MELLDNLAAIGLTTKVLQYIIIGGIAIFLIGMYWQYIVVGAGIIFAVVILLSSSPSTNASLPTNSEKIEENVNPADIAPAEFLEDCVRYNEGATKSSCQKSWKDQGNGVN
jgi:hypothetical protein